MYVQMNIIGRIWEIFKEDLDKWMCSVETDSDQMEVILCYLITGEQDLYLVFPYH